MGMLGFIILSGAIGVNASNNPSSMSKDASKALIKAIYIETKTDKKVKEIEKRISPDFIKKHGGWIVGVTRLAVEQKVSFEWTF